MSGRSERGQPTSLLERSGRKISWCGARKRPSRSGARVNGRLPGGRRSLSWREARRLLRATRGIYERGRAEPSDVARNSLSANENLSFWLELCESNCISVACGVWTDDEVERTGEPQGVTTQPRVRRASHQITASSQTTSRIQGVSLHPLVPLLVSPPSATQYSPS